MSVKAMIFVDGSWLYHNRKVIVNAASGDECEIDYEKLPKIVSEILADRLDIDVDIVRTCYFGVIAINKPGYNPAKQKAFYDYLAERCFFETELHSIDFRRTATSRLDERCVEIALASAMMYYAAISGAFDVAILLAGDLDYLPLLRRVRALGKRVQLVGIHNTEKRIATSQELMQDSSLYDFPPIYLDDYVANMRHQRVEKDRTCTQCGESEKTDWSGPEFVCTNCRDSQRKKLRVCDSCGQEEETSWNKSYFYCIECRRNYRNVNQTPSNNNNSEDFDSNDDDDDFADNQEIFEPLDAFDADAEPVV